MYSITLPPSGVAVNDEDYRYVGQSSQLTTILFACNSGRTFKLIETDFELKMHHVSIDWKAHVTFISGRSWHGKSRLV